MGATLSRRATLSIFLFIPFLCSFIFVWRMYSRYLYGGGDWGMDYDHDAPWVSSSSWLPDPESHTSSDKGIVNNTPSNKRRKSNEHNGRKTATVTPRPVINFPRTIHIMDHASANGHYYVSDNASARKRKIHVEKEESLAWQYIDDDKNYQDDRNHDRNYKGAPPEECIPISLWHTYSFPNCNLIHELALQVKALSDEFFYVASGGYSDVFRVHHTAAFNPDLDLALKILSPGKKHRAGIPHTSEYSTYHYDVVRRDALIMERLTKSSHVLPVYGYCGFAVIVPYADRGGNGDVTGTLASALTGSKKLGKPWENMSSTVRLKYAAEAAKGLADIHDLGVVHADLTIKQYLIRNGMLQLGDFNRAIVLRRNSTAVDGSACKFLLTDNYGTTRAPEEYSHKPQTNAIDVWTLGSIIYHILTGKKVWSSARYKKNDVQEAVVKGLLPEINNKKLNSLDPVNKILKDALDLCYIYEPSQRGTAREVATLLDKGLRELH